MHYALSSAVMATLFWPFIKVVDFVSELALIHYGPHETIPLWAIVIALLVFIVLILCWNYLFLHTWFFYLKYFAPAYKRLVESRIRTRLYEPHYSISKALFP